MAPQMPSTSQSGLVDHPTALGLDVDLGWGPDIGPSEQEPLPDDEPRLLPHGITGNNAAPINEGVPTSNKNSNVKEAMVEATLSESRATPERASTAAEENATSSPIASHFLPCPHAVASSRELDQKTSPSRIFRSIRPAQYLSIPTSQPASSAAATTTVGCTTTQPTASGDSAATNLGQKRKYDGSAAARWDGKPRGGRQGGSRRRAMQARSSRASDRTRSEEDAASSAASSTKNDSSTAPRRVPESVPARWDGRPRGSRRSRFGRRGGVSRGDSLSYEWNESSEGTDISEYSSSEEEENAEVEEKDPSDPSKPVLAPGEKEKTVPTLTTSSIVAAVKNRSAASVNKTTFEKMKTGNAKSKEPDSKSQQKGKADSKNRQVAKSNIKKTTKADEGKEPPKKKQRRA
ncbi:hypothetical protein V8F20_001387 [Naviculisporaceae sp. PSN 640]